ncbi:glycosyltransferase 87 family protein [Streptomyces sp. NRRL F-4474]|uniref:glycosyltransferase 87 family protein n=1 Tax=Streptomyces sp. NRRL F-4474 TaxID=1463851 RepID=UPI000A877748|nr:glycosyltransferase 87 family protein [Streptomyces sp. NRRL F-4474]
MLPTGSLLVPGVLRIALRVPMADDLVEGFSAAEWRPPAGYPPLAAILFAPAAWLPAGMLKAVLVLGDAGLIALLIALSSRHAGLPAACGTSPAPGPRSARASRWASPPGSP